MIWDIAIFKGSNTLEKSEIARSFIFYNYQGSINNVFTLKK